MTIEGTLATVAAIGLVGCIGSLIVIEFGHFMSGSQQPTYEAAIAYGVLAIAAMNVLRIDKT